MEKGMQMNHYDSSSESTHSKKLKKQQNNSTSMLYKLDWFPITTSPWIASMAFLPSLLFIIHCMDFYAENSHTVFKQEKGLTLISGFISKNIVSIAYIFNILFSLLSMLSLFYSRNEAEGYQYILGWLGSKTFPALRYLIEINLAIAAWFLIRIPQIAVLFVVAAFVNIFVNFFAQNYTLRKDYLCCKSMQFLMLFKSIIIVSYALNCAGYYLIKESPSLIMLFISLQLLLALILFISFFTFGYLMHRHTSSQLSLIVIINLFISISLGSLFDCAVTLVEEEFVNNQNLVFAGCFFVGFNALSYGLWSKIKRYGSDENSLNISKKIFFIFNKLQNSSESINDDCEIRGIIRNHLSTPCPNPQCFTHRQDGEYYDAKKNKHCFSSKLNQGKTSFVKFIVKCLYEEQLHLQRWQNTDLLLEYIQFYFMKLKNLFRVSHLLVELDKRFLTPFQKLRLERLRRVMLQENRKINQELYGGNLDIENLIVSEDKFDEIRGQLNEILERNISFWNYVQNDSINLSIMAKILKPNFRLIDKINANWKFIVRYFDIQNIWKFYYACYTLYIKNQKLKAQFLEYFGQSTHEDEVFQMESQHIDKTSDSQKLYIAKMIFEQDSCCIHIDNNENRQTIKNVSRYFERMFGYQSHEILESSLDVLMLPCFRKFHLKRFLKWAGDGKSSNEGSFDVKKIFPRNIQGFIIPCFKFYKQYLCLNRDLQYVAMLKRNSEEENIIILNEDYQIQGMTKSVAERLQIYYADYPKLLGVNILIFMKELIYFTKFEEQKTNLDIEHANSNTYEQSPAMLSKHQNNFHKFTTNNLSGGKSGSSRKNHSAKKEFTKNNMIFSFPEDFEGICSTYKNMKKNQNLEKDQIFSAITKAQKIFQEEGEGLVFRVEIEIRNLSIDDEHSYIELCLREIENTNKKRGTGEHMNKKCQRSSVPKGSLLSSQDKVLQDQSHQSSEINSEEFFRFFENSQNSQNISLSFSDNIFIKEENNQSVEMISHVKSISVSVRIIFALFSVLLLVSLLFEYQSYQEYGSNAAKMGAFVLFHLKSLAVGNKYYSDVLGLQKTKRNILELTQDIRDVRKMSEFKQVMLDKELNQIKTYHQFQSPHSTQFDEIDVIDRIFQNMIEIRYNYIDALTPSNHAFQQFTNLVLPAIEELSINVQANLNERFTVSVQTMEIKNTIYIIIGIILLLLGFVLVFSRLIKITRSFVSLMEIFTQFSEVDLKKIIKYCTFLSYMFAHLGAKYDQFRDPQVKDETVRDIKVVNNNSQSGGSRDLKASTVNNQNSAKNSKSEQFSGTGAGFASQIQPLNGMNQQKQDIDNANLNKKVKKVENGKQLTRLKIKSIIFLIVFLIVFGLSSFGLNLYISIINKEVKSLEESGYTVFSYYSTMNIEIMGMKDRAVKRESFDYSRIGKYHHKVEEMKVLKKQNKKALNKKFVEMKDAIMFDNLCQLYPDVLKKYGYTVSECLNAAQSNFQHGIQSFLFYLTSKTDEYMSSASYTLEESSTAEIEKGIQICNIFFEFMIEEWCSQFNQIVKRLKFNIITICLCLIVFQIIMYVVLIEVMIVGNLKESYTFFRKIYEGLMPDFIVTKEKIIKAKLEVEGIIKK